MWIGTNDLGEDAFITDSQVSGKTIPDYIDCIYQVFDQIYDNGGRYFVLMNNAPLQLSPLYATPENNGVRLNHYWPNKPENITEVSYRMWEQVATANSVFQYRTPFELLVKRRYPGASFAVMDMYSLVRGENLINLLIYSHYLPDFRHLLQSIRISRASYQRHWFQQTLRH